MQKYDLIVIGSGPAGEKGAVKAAYFGRKVALIEKKDLFGGAGVHTGTLPSKTLKETALFLSGKVERGLYGINRGLEREASIEDFMYRKDLLSQSEGSEVLKNLKQHGVDIFHGTAAFEDSHQVRIKETNELIYGEYILISTGSFPYHPPYIPFDGKRILDSDTILQLTRFPKSICVLGAGVIGCEYATIFSTLGTKVFLVNDKDKILPFIDEEITKELILQMQRDQIEIIFNTSVDKVVLTEKDVRVTLKSGQIIDVDMFLFAAGRQGASKGLNAEKIGLKIDERGFFVVDNRYCTNIPHIFAVGDVIGYPALASTSMDQGRVAVAQIYQTKDLEHIANVYPFGIYTVPEISQVGLSEQEAQKQKITYVVGRARYKDMPRGKIMGAQYGFLKILFSLPDLKVIGVSLIGHIATELIHYGMELTHHQTLLNDIIGRVFNSPTLHELYKYAAYDALSTHTGKRIKS